MEIVWTGSNLISLSLTEEIDLIKEFTKLIIFDYHKLINFLKENGKEKLKDILTQNDVKPLLISHDFKLPLEGENKQILEIYELSKELDIPFLLINPCEKPSNISFNVALEMFSKNLSKSLSKIDLPVIIRISAFSVVNTLSKAYKVLNSIREREKLSLGFDIFHFYLGGEDFDVFRDKDLSQIKFVFFKGCRKCSKILFKRKSASFSRRRGYSFSSDFDLSQRWGI